MSCGPDSFCCVGFAVDLSHRHDSAAVPSGEFLFPVTRPVPGPGPQVRAWEASSAPTPPLTSPSLSALGGPGCTFPYLQHKTALFLHPGHVHAPGGWGWEVAPGPSIPARRKRLRRLCLVWPCAFMT